MIRSIRMGTADSLARSGKPAAIARAIALEPGNDSWAARRAILLFESGDTSPVVETELLRANSRRPDDSSVQMALGLLYEQQGNLEDAEKLLSRAVHSDRRFTPAWTLANFYYRTGRFDRMWPHIRSCLALIEPKNLEPWSFDPAPIYELAWQANQNARFILNLVPRKRETLLPYVAFLTAHPEFRPDGANESPEEFAGGVWPEVIRVATPADSKVLMEFLDAVVRSGVSRVAVRTWNNLIDRGFLRNTRLDPDQGVSVADPDFTNLSSEYGFGWKIPYTPGVIRNPSPRSLSLEFTGTEPELFPVVATYAPVLSGRTYHLRWNLEKSGIPGFTTELHPTNSSELIPCKSLDCEFSVPAGVSELQVRLVYRRPAGAMRLRDTVVLKNIRLELEK